MPRKHRYLADMMSELETSFQPPVANYIFLNSYFFTESKPDVKLSSDFTIARLLHRVSIVNEDTETVYDTVCLFTPPHSPFISSFGLRLVQRTRMVQHRHR